MAENTIALRVAVRDADSAIRALRQLGADGDAALAKITQGAPPASRALGGLGAAIGDVFGDLQGRVTASLGPFEGLAARVSAIGPAGAAAVVGVGAVVAGLAAGVRGAAEAERSFARLDAVLKATGGSAGVSARDIAAIGDELEATTLASAEGVQDAAGALATFRNVSGSTFTEALRLSGDLAAVFGGDLRGAAVQLGKALENPVEGINALRRSGVSFSADQKQVIADLVETGRVADAQRIILDALAGQVGGAAAAEGDTLAGAFSQAGAAAGNFFEALANGSGVVDFVKRDLKALADTLNGLAAGRSTGARIAGIDKEIGGLRADIATEDQSGAPVPEAQETRRRRVAELERERAGLLKELDRSRQEADRTDQQGRVQQERIRQEDLRGRIKATEEEIGKQGARYETEAQGIARVNAELDKRLAKIEATKKAAVEAGLPAAEIARLDAAAERARANARAEVEALGKPRRTTAAREDRKDDRERERREDFARDVQAELDAAEARNAAAREGKLASEEAAAAVEAEAEVRRRKIDVDSAEGRALLDKMARTRELKRATDDLVESRKAELEIGRQSASTGTLAEAAGLRAGPRRLFPAANDNDDPAARSANISAVVAAEGSRERARAFGEEAESLDDLRDRASFIERYVGQIKDPAAREETARRANALYDEAEAVEQAAAAADLRRELARETGEESRIAATLGQSAAARRRVRFEIEAENRVRGANVNLLSAEGQKLKAETVALMENTAARERGEDKAQNKAEQVTDLIVGPFEDAAGDIQDLLGDAIKEGLADGSASFKDFAAGLTESFQNSTADLFSGIIIEPLNEALAKAREGLTASITQSLQGGGSVTGGIGSFIKQNPGTAGVAAGTVAGTAGGAVASAITGEVSPYAGVGTAIGTAAGAVIGGVIFPAVGAFAGAAIGGAIGGLAGGLLGGGGGENNDAQGYRFNPTGDGGFEKTDRKGSAQNAEKAMALARDARSSARLLQSQGLRHEGEALEFKVGNNSGTEFNGETFDTTGMAVNAAIRSLIENSVGEIPKTLRAVLDNTEAESFDQLKADLDFGREFDRLVNDTTKFADALNDLRDNFAEAIDKAGDLGLSTADLAKAQAKAEKELRESSIRDLEMAAKQSADTLRGTFSGVIDPIKQALGSFGTSFGVAAPQATIEGGLSEFRDVLRRARGDDMTAISALPGQGQQLLQAARQYGASGEAFQEIFREVNKGLREVLGVQERRRDEILASIPDTMRITTADIIKSQDRGYREIVDELARVRRDLKLLKVA